MITIASLLSDAENEFRNVYWKIRNSRSTNWDALNKTRLLAEILTRCGIPQEEVKRARYCLRQQVCNRCVGDPDGLKCHAFAARNERGDY